MAKKKKKRKSLKRYFFYLLLLVFGFIGFIVWLGFEQAKLDSDIATYFEVRGVDVSHHNGKVDWAKVADQGVLFTYVKITEGVSHADKHAIRNCEKALENGLSVGAYHFFAFKRDGAEQAKYFLSKIKDVKLDLPPAIDVEYAKINKKSYNRTVNDKVVRNIALFDSVICARTGQRCVIYTNKECYEDLIRDRFPDNELWICNLTEEPEATCYPNWVIWQHCHKGEIEGIKTDVDLNVFHASRDKFKEWLHRDN